MSRPRNLARLLATAAVQPRFAAELLGAAWRFRRRRWWARPPFLPLPPPEYIDWRLDTAYASRSPEIPTAPLRRYLRWTRAQTTPRRDAGVIQMRALLVIFVLLAAVLAIPPVRAVAGPVLAPGKDIVDRTIGRVWERARDRMFLWSVRNEARTLAEELRAREVGGDPLPRPQDFQAYLQRRTISGTPGLDKWGNPYYMILGGDSITVVSPGADGRPGTDDDIREAVSRSR